VFQVFLLSIQNNDAIYSGVARQALGEGLQTTSESLQIGRDVATVTGLGMTVTGIGAEVGIPTATVGATVSKAELTMEISGDFIKNGINKNYH